jgi:hypothetical protein
VLYQAGRAVPGGEGVIVRDVLNTRPPDQLAAWLDGLGSFDLLTPHDAAERWGVELRTALERLHCMVGGPLEVPDGHVETYRRAEWTAAASAPSRAKAPRIEEVRLHRLAMVPREGATREQLQAIWGLNPTGTDKNIKWMVENDLLAFDWKRTKNERMQKIWRRI